MQQQVLFIQGGGDDGFHADQPMVRALQAALGTDYEIVYPELKSDDQRSDFGWPRQIGQLIDQHPDGLILAGHSLGASLILKYLSETTPQKRIAGLFLLAPPFWSGEEDWKQGLILRPDFGTQLPKEVPIGIYQCLDDDVVPPAQFDRYREHLPQATFRLIETGGHQFNNGMNIVARDIQQL
ncbi:alpha/beta fold hydrolase [Paraflavitalea pollutisoli]|uniref:alpha/beta fold hydrolase n=1 Tax=Paraflavitalea pollutisoli TaxID=3034143 RepID=UPI0023EDC1FA|nr:alpha/beta fold hydrolase [Paraflavitalea sp. H1-2-19X]